MFYCIQPLLLQGGCPHPRSIVNTLIGSFWLIWRGKERPFISTHFILLHYPTIVDRTSSMPSYFKFANIPRWWSRRVDACAVRTGVTWLTSLSNVTFPPITSRRMNHRRHVSALLVTFCSLPFSLGQHCRDVGLAPFSHLLALPF